MSKNIFKKTLLSSALGLMLGFQGVQDAAATTISYADAFVSGPDYSVTSGDVMLDFALISYGSIAQADGIIDGGYEYDYGYAFGHAAAVGNYFSVTSSYSETYSEGGMPSSDYVYANASANNSLAVADSGSASSSAYATYSFTATGEGVLDLLAPFYYQLYLETDTGECGSATATGMMSVSLHGGQVESPEAKVHSQNTCNGSDLPSVYDEDYDLLAHMTVTDGASGYITLYAAAFAEFFPEAVKALPLPASFGMMILGLMMLFGLRRRDGLKASVA